MTSKTFTQTKVVGMHPYDQVFGILLIGLTILSYFLNLGLNNIWTPNESFYAESVREMLASGNYLDIYYNYEPRYNKPPLLYWLMAISAKLFGLSEFSIRLPIALCGLGTIFLVYKLGELLESKKLGIIAAIIMAFSFQFVINARYGSPAVPLTFFFTLTIYLFYKGYQEANFLYVLLAYIALGFTMLMKGYPYLIIITLIIGVFLLFESKLNWKDYWQKIRFLRPWLGLPLAVLIGMSWIAYMYWTFGEEFYEVFMDETYRRAFTKKSSWKPFYYLEANIWGFLPYSITFYLALIWVLATKFSNFFNSKALKLGLSWFGVMLIVFTIAKGKIPTYFIQAHPGMSIFSAYFLLNILPNVRSKKLNNWLKLQFYLPGGIFVALSVVMLYFFEAHFLFYLIALLPLIGLAFSTPFNLSWLRLSFFPFYSFLITYLLFGAIVLPSIEKGFRNQHLIGQSIIEKVEDQSIPLYIEDFLIHNLPFYAERKVLPYRSSEEIQEQFAKGKCLAMVPSERIKYYKGGKEIWRGIIYYGSETRTLEFIINTLKYNEGGESLFKEYVVLYKGT